ncbi:CHAT domain-containing protein [Mycena sp. CBHHK59/15]|nr:CHAT domain-containing protein [Mycena sp. CBHHK59/15]
MEIPSFHLAWPALTLNLSDSTRTLRPTAEKPPAELALEGAKYTVPGYQRVCAGDERVETMRLMGVHGQARGVMSASKRGVVGVTRQRVGVSSTNTGRQRSGRAPPEEEVRNADHKVLWRDGSPRVRRLSEPSRDTTHTLRGIGRSRSVELELLAGAGGARRTRPKHPRLAGGRAHNAQASPERQRQTRFRIPGEAVPIKLATNDASWEDRQERNLDAARLPGHRSQRTAQHRSRSASLEGRMAALVGDLGPIRVIDEISEGGVPEMDRGLQWSMLRGAIILRDHNEERMEQCRSSFLGPCVLHLVLNLSAAALSRDDVDEFITVQRLNLILYFPPGHPDRPENLIVMGFQLYSLFLQRRLTDALEEAIQYSREALSLRPSPDVHELHSLALNLLGSCLSERYKLRDGVSDLDEAIACHLRVLSLRPEGHAERGVTLNSLGEAFWLRFEQLAKTVDLVKSLVYSRGGFIPVLRTKDMDTAELCCRELLRLCPAGDPDHALAAQTLASHFLARFELHNDISILEEAISLCQIALRFRPPGHPLRCATLESLAVAIRLRFQQRAKPEDIERAIAYGKEALDLCSSNPRASFGPLHGLGLSHLVRFQTLGHIDDLHQALESSQAALRLNHRHAFLTFTNMMEIYRHRFHRLQNVGDLAEATRCGLEALRSSPPGDPGKFLTLNNIADVMFDRFERSGNMEHLEDAISYCRQSISKCPPGHSDQVLPSINLALLLSTRLHRLGETSDMTEAILTGERATALCPPGHPRRGRCLEIMVATFQVSWNQTRDISHLDRAVVYAREALPLYSVGNIDHPRSRQSLAVVLFSRFLQTQQVSYLEEAIMLYREALDSYPEEGSDYGIYHANLAAALSIQFDHVGDGVDLQNAINHYEKAEEAASLEYPLQPIVKYGFALTCLKINPITDTITTKAFDLFKSACHHPSASVHTQFEAAIHWSFTAQRYRHQSTIGAFSRLLALLEARLLVKQTVESQQEFLRRIPFRLLSCDAASAAIDQGTLSTAVELLEQGRTLLWSRMRGYRHPINDLRAVNESLADELQMCLGFRATIDPVSSAAPGGSSSLNLGSSRVAVDNRLRAHRVLSDDWSRILAQIRLMEGFEDFLRTPSFDVLRSAANEGPVILVNVNSSRCDAIILFPTHDPLLVPLPDAASDFLDNLSSQLLDALASGSDRRAKKMVPILRDLWRAVVRPVVEHLVSLEPLQTRGFGGQKNLPDLFVSSYTPTLTALIAARKGAPAPSVPRLLVVGNADTLPMVEDEVREVKQLGDFVDVLLGSAATKDSVISSLRTHTWAHFACHASRHAEPFRSAFELSGGDRVTLLDLVGARLPHAEFAFLSACHTAAPDFGGTPDEFINLAAGMQFVGFRGVVSTFWVMADEDGPLAARDFYSHMFLQESVSDPRAAAAALNSTTRLMRKRNVPLDRWAPSCARRRTRLPNRLAACPLREDDANAVNASIDTAICTERQDHRKKRIVCLLLRGSGKSTTLRQFQRLYTPTAFREERNLWHVVTPALTRPSPGRRAPARCGPQSSSHCSSPPFVSLIACSLCGDSDTVARRAAWHACKHRQYSPAWPFFSSNRTLPPFWVPPAPPPPRQCSDVNVDADGALYVRAPALAASVSSIVHHFLPAEYAYKLQPGTLGYEMLYVTWPWHVAPVFPNLGTAARRGEWQRSDDRVDGGLSERRPHDAVTADNPVSLSVCRASVT